MNSTENRNFAEMVSQQLRENGWTQKRFAEYIGKDESTVSLWMCGRKTPNILEKRTISKLAKFLHTTSGEVQKILSEQKERAEDGMQKGTKVIKSLHELENVLKEEKLLFNQVFPYSTKITAKGIEERFLEQE